VAAMVRGTSAFPARAQIVRLSPPARVAARALRGGHRERSFIVMSESRVTVKIPRPLYRKIQLVIEKSGFSSPTDFIVFVLRDLLGEAEIGGREHEAASAPHREDFSAHELDNVKQKLRNLGYL
jgi:Arc/MetJ-type ribon-helix-helix transcriptional regulator